MMSRTVSAMAERLGAQGLRQRGDHVGGDDAVGAMRRGGVPGNPVLRGATCTLDGDVPAARVHELRQRLPGLTRGEALLDTAFHRYEPVRGAAPRRPRTDDDPLHREEYIRRVSGWGGR